MEEVSIIVPIRLLDHREARMLPLEEVGIVILQEDPHLILMALDTKEVRIQTTLEIQVVHIIRVGVLNIKMGPLLARLLLQDHIILLKGIEIKEIILARTLLLLVLLLLEKNENVSDML
jgi:hypothetical protein